MRKLQSASFESFADPPKPVRPMIEPAVDAIASAFVLADGDPRADLSRAGPFYCYRSPC